MNDPTKRDQWDQHNRDEAMERAVQQEAAGPSHRPVPAEPYASAGASPAARDASVDAAALRDDYERATAAERLAWLAVRDLLADGSAAGALNEWRDAVERTQQAARALVSYESGRSARA